MTRSLERAYMPAISWGAVFAGSLFAFALASLLYLFGAAVGLTTMAALNELSRGVAIGAAVWMVLSWIVASFAGGWLAGRLAGRSDGMIGGAHGAVVWALTGTAAFLMFVMPLGGLVSGGARLGGQAMQAGGAAAGRTQLPPQVEQALRTQLADQVGRAVAATAPDVDPAEARRAIEQLDQADLEAIAASLVSGQPAEAQRILAANTTLSDAEVAQVVSGTQAAMRDQLGGMAEQAGDIASAALWTLFLISLLSLGAATWGGRAGARRAERFYDRVAPAEGTQRPEDWYRPEYRPEERARPEERVERPEERPIGTRR